MRYGALKIALIYLIISLIWITFSDRLLIYLLNDANGRYILMLSTFKGYFFIFCTGLFLYVLIRADDKALKQSESQYRDMYQSNHTPMWIYDTETLQIVSVNDAATEVYGYHRDDFLKKTMAQITYIDEGEDVHLQDNDVFANETEGDRRHIKVDGSVFYVNLSLHKIQFNGKPHMLAMVRDMTDQILYRQSLDKINRDLQAEKKKLSETQLISKVAGWEFYPAANNLIWSDEFYEIFGVSKADKRPAFEIYVSHIFAEDREMMLKGLHELVTQGKQIDVTHRITAIDGSLRYVRQLARLETVSPEVKVVGSAQDITELKQLEIERNKYLYNFEDTLNSISDAFFALDNDMRVIRINEAFRQMTGQPTSEVLGESIFKIFPKAHNRFYEHYEKALRERVIIKHEDYSEVLHKWIRMAAFPTNDGVSVYFADISEDRLKDIKLKEAVERYELVAQATRDVIYDLDIVNDSIIYNTSLTQLVNMPFEHIRYNLRWWRGLIHPADAEEVVASQERVKRLRKTNWECEYRIYCGNGEYKYIMDQGYFVFNEQHEPVRLIGAIRDIDALKRSTQENKRLADIITRVNNMIIVTDVDNSITWVNKAFEDNTGHLLHDIKGKTPYQVLNGPEFDKSLDPEFREKLLRRKPFTTDFVIYTADQQVVWVSAEFTPFYNDENEYSGYIAVYQNITSRKEKEVEIQRQNNFLRELAWMSSHQMRRPVATMLGLMGLMDIAEKDEEKEEILPMLGTSIKEMDEIVHNIHVKINDALQNEPIGNTDEMKKNDVS
ncbi:PAS domain S-box protein [Mucilaginibacter sp. UR6-1]|uniref:PAS domain S-box protein n=1 Tax=Mucilaginibacter sp. UR6-1 TaxID=1435643 RepID=UPI001E3F4B8E|nr:PAS domain S-box protein [Mucilaginibacter sp. UR6-1]MCC8410121.1 PAS domain S-box protein [Mucilaginibacter sp. UR6-1]